MIPCYNESGNLAALGAAVGPLVARGDVEVILVDNGSTDDTAERLPSLMVHHPGLRTVRVPVNQGYGYGILAGLHVATTVPNVVFQESVRAHIRTFYSALIETNVVIENGFALPPEAPGLGTKLRPELFDAKRETYRVTRCQ